MNLLHIRYAVEVAKTNSINQAAEKLYVGQSALSRAIKELEKNLGVTLFERSAKGMFPTPDGRVFLSYACKILKQVDEMESALADGTAGKIRFSVSALRAEYISDAFARFTAGLDRTREAELLYKEAGTFLTLRHVLREEAQLGIIRYAVNYDAYFKSMLDERGLEYEMVGEFENVLLMSRESPLAECEHITRADLRDCFEIVYSDPNTPSVPLPTVQKDALQEEGSDRRIVLFERSGEFELLQNPYMFLYTSPVSDATLKRMGLVQRRCEDVGHRFKDVVIRRREHKLGDLDCEFLEQLIHAKRDAFGPDCD